MGFAGFLALNCFWECIPCCVSLFVTQFSLRSYFFSSSSFLLGGMLKEIKSQNEQCQPLCTIFGWFLVMLYEAVTNFELKNKTCKCKHVKSEPIVHVNLDCAVRKMFCRGTNFYLMVVCKLLMVSSLMILLILLFSHQSSLGMGISLELTERFNSSTLANLEKGVKVKAVRVD